MKAAERLSEPFWLLSATSMGAPGAPAGVTQVIDVSLIVTTLVAGLPSNVTTFAEASFAWKPVPVSTTSVPPPEDPSAGATLVTVGSGWNVKMLVFVDDPLPLVMTTSTVVPATPAGVSHRMVLMLVTTTFAAATPSKVTLVVPEPFAMNFDPMSATVVPPRDVAEAGKTELSRGRRLLLFELLPPPESLQAVARRARRIHAENLGRTRPDAIGIGLVIVEL